MQWEQTTVQLHSTTCGRDELKDEVDQFNLDLVQKTQLAVLDEPMLHNKLVDPQTTVQRMGKVFEYRSSHL